MATRLKSQIHFEETIHEDPELQQLLDERQDLKESVSQFRKKDKECKELISAIHKPMPIRVGPYIITSQNVVGRSVSFDIEGGTRIRIKHIG